MEKKLTHLLLLFLLITSINKLSAQCSDLFISEYIEGSSFNKAVEIYNANSSSIDLSNYELHIFFNGNNTASSIISLSSILNSDSTYVVANANADSIILSVTNLNTGSLNFNGDDALALINTSSNDTVDIFGVIGVDPGSSWSISGTNSTNGTTANRTLVRDTTVRSGNKDWLVSSSTEWLVFPTDAFDSLGIHSANCASSSLPLSVNLVIDSTVSCNGAADGGATALASGGISPYTYLWSNSDTNSSTTGLLAGVYTVTITDANAVSLIDSITITEPNNLTATITIDSNVSCHGGSDGMLSVTANGGTSPYTYSWSNSATNDSLNNVTAGLYVVTVTDANSCTTSDSAIVSQPTALSVTTTVVNNVSINGGNNGKAYATATGGTAPYTYAWAWAASTDTVSNLVAGTYSVTVSDNNACTSISSFLITEPSPLISSILISNVSCHGFQDGGLTANISGGVTPYSYLWSNSGATSSVNNLSGGTYSVTITDANGATVVDSGTVSEPAALSVTTTVVNHVSFNGASDGKAYVSASGGTAPYTYNWNSGIPPIDTASGLSAGNYQVTVSDANGCSAVDSVNLIVLSNHLPKLVITEIMYNAAESGTDTTEYIEILNADTTKVALNGFSFPNGVTHTFGALDSIAVGDYAIIAYDSSAFRNRYGFDADFIWTSGGLSNSGELIVLANQFGQAIDSVDFDDASPWPFGSSAGEPDGGGASIELLDSNLNNMLGQNWISSPIAVQGKIINGLQVYGSPGSGPLAVGLNSVASKVENDIIYYPNPSKGQLIVEVNQREIEANNLLLEIYTLNGKKVYERQLLAEKELLNLNSLSNGVYFIRIQSQTQKLIISQ